MTASLLRSRARIKAEFPLCQVSLEGDELLTTGEFMEPEFYRVRKRKAGDGE